MQQHSPGSNSSSTKSEDSGVGENDVARKTSTSVSFKQLLKGQLNFRPEMQLFRAASYLVVPQECLSRECLLYWSNWNR